MPRKRQSSAVAVLDPEDQLPEELETEEVEETVDLPGTEEASTDEEPEEDPFRNMWTADLEVEAQDHCWLYFRDRQEEMSSLLPMWQRQWELYLNKSKLQRYTRVHGMQVYVPRAFLLTETIAPRLAKAIFGADKWFAIQSIEDKDKDGAEVAEALMYWNADHDRWVARGTDWIKMACIHGFGVIKCEYRRRKVEVPARKGVEESVTDAAGRETGKRTRLQAITMEERTDEYVRWRVLPPHAYFQARSDISPQDAAHGVGDEFEIDFQYLKEEEAAGRYHDVDRLLVGLDGIGDKPGEVPSGLTGRQMSNGAKRYFGWDTAFWTWPYKQARDIAAGLSTYKFARHDEEGNWTFTVRVVQKKFPLFGMKKPWVDCEIHMVGPFCLRIARNSNPLGTTDYHVIQLYNHPGYGAQGQGVIEPNRSLMVEEAEHRNLLLDASALRVRPMGWRVQNGMVPAGENVWKSGGWFDVRFKDAIGWIPSPPSMMESQQQAAILEQLQNSVAGNPPVLEGLSEGSRETSGAVSTRKEEAMTRHNWSARIMEMDGVKGLLEHSLALQQTHMTVPRVVRILGVNGWTYKEVTPDQIMGRYELSVKTAAEVSNESLQVNQATNLLQTAISSVADPQMAGGVDRLEIFKSIAEMMRIPGRDKWFHDKKKNALTFWKEVQTFRYGGKVEVSQDDDAVGFMQYVMMPGPSSMDPMTGMQVPGKTIMQEFEEDQKIDPIYKDEFKAFVMERADLAQQQMMAAMGGGLGMAGMPAGAAPPGPPGVPSPQERPRSPDGIERSAGQGNSATPMSAGATHKGMQ